MSTYNKAVDLAENIEKETQKFPRNTYYLVNLMNKAASEISVNIAKGNKNIRQDERKNFFWSARGSIQDIAELLDVAGRQGFINDQTRVEFKATLEDLSSDIQTLIRTSPQISEN